MSQITNVNYKAMQDEIIAIIAKYFHFKIAEVAVVYEREKSLDGTIALCEGAIKNNRQDDLIVHYANVIGRRDDASKD